MFIAVLGSQQNFAQTPKKLYVLPAHNTCTISPTIHILHQSGTCVTIDEPTLMHYCHQKSIVYVMIHFWCYALSGFGQMWMICVDNCNIVQISFTAHKVPCTPPIHHFLHPSPGNHWSWYCPHSFTSFRMLHSWNHRVPILFKLASFN